jgi:hypothetical protein
MGDQKINIQVSLFASGCLPSIFAEKIESVGRYLLANHDKISSAQMDEFEVFLGQLRECREAVDFARAKPGLSRRRTAERHDGAGRKPRQGGLESAKSPS